MTIFEANTGDATVVSADQIDELRFEHDRCPGLLRGIDKQPVNDGTPRSVETINVVLRFDLHRDDLVAVVKRCRSNHRRTGRFDSLENTPASELDNAGAHEGVGRDRIAAVATAVDREHTKASSREKQRGGCAGAPGSDNDDVEIDRWGNDGDNISTTSEVASRVRLGFHEQQHQSNLAWWHPTRWASRGALAHGERERYRTVHRDQRRQEPTSLR
jgi:hypothetical protein